MRIKGFVVDGNGERYPVGDVVFRAEVVWPVDVVLPEMQGIAVTDDETGVGFFFKSENGVGTMLPGEILKMTLTVTGFPPAIPLDGILT